MPYSLTVYRPIGRGEAAFEGDAQVERIVGKECNSAGTNLVNLIRDMSFEFEDEQVAESACAAARAAGLTVDLERFDEEAE